MLFPTPRERLLEMMAPTRFKATLEEPVVPVDPTSGQKAEQLPTYNVYSIDGDVTGPLVYVNYGRPEDYDELETLGVSVRGAIVIARYGGSFRGTKPKIAAEHGAIGCLIYSDPRDDGYFADAVFPDGPMRSKDGVQRGSVMDLPTYSGDPLTPGAPAIPGTTRLAITDAPTLTKIPVLPISYGDAQPLLDRDARTRGAGGLARRIADHLSAGARSHAGAPEGLVQLGHEADLRRHRHAFRAPRIRTNGSFAAIITTHGSTARRIRSAAWRRRSKKRARSGTLAETGLAAEADHRLCRLGRRRGRRCSVRPSGSSSTTKSCGRRRSSTSTATATAAASSSRAARTRSSSSSTRWHAASRIRRRRARSGNGGRRTQISEGSKEKRAESRTRANLRIGALGSGSDYTPFLQHHGTASLNLSFGGMDDDGIYHSIYDDFYHFTKFSDPGFRYGQALAQLVGTAVIRLADADVLPYEFTGLADTAQTYVKELQDLLKQRQDDVRERNRQIADGVFAAVNDPKRPRPIPSHRAGAAGDELRAARERRDGADAGGRPLPEGAA